MTKSADRNDRLFTGELVGIAVAVLLGAVMTVLDATIVNVALPVVGRDLGASIEAIQWVATAYLLAFVAVIPTTGWATARYGARRVWLAALALFLVGSLLCAAAGSVPQLLAARVVQGLGGGMVMPVGQAMLAQRAGPEHMGRVMAVIGVPLLLAPISGPVVGGALVGAVGWRWIFLVNVPVGALALITAVRLLPATPRRPAAPLDRRGLLLLPGGLALVVYGLASAAGAGAVTDTRTVAALLVGAGLVAGYVAHALRTPHALVDVRLLANRSFGSAAAASFALGAALFAVALLLPLYLEIVRGLTPLLAGLLLVPQGVGAALAMPVAGALADRVGPRWVVVGGTVVAAAGVGALTQLTATTPYPVFCAALLLVGIGLGATITPAMAAGFRDLEPSAMPQASSAIATVQRLAGSVGAALLAGVLQHQTRERLPGLRGGLDAAGALAAARPAGVLAALAAAFAATFVVALVMTLAAIVPAGFLSKIGQRAHAEPARHTKEDVHVRRARPHDRVGA